ncbi:GNAT family N-acetyltransferase [candidate division KSB1 bacterium]|nr:GNAT family N-acetyltransferase [candidate division KSB1 bacterium]
MPVIDLTPEYEDLYFVCLSDWSDEMKKAGDHKACWYQKMKDKGLRVKLALTAEGKVAGMIHYCPVEYSFVEGENLYVVLCIWVHGHKEGRGNMQKRGFGKQLLQAAEQDVRQLGSGGLVVWGMALPLFMRASWFKKQGFKKADRAGMMVLLWKKFKQDVKPPQWLRNKTKPETTPGKVSVTCVLNGWCPAMNMVAERARRAAAELGDDVKFQIISNFDKNDIRKWGQTDALFIDARQMRTGPPPSYEKIKNRIRKRLLKLNRKRRE